MQHQTSQTTAAYPFLAGSGEMATLIRSHNWAATPLGPPSEWDQSLRTLVGTLLNSKFPMFIFWGPEHICFYNDAYRPSLGKDGKHPSALGQRAEKVWPEIWDAIGPQIEQVLSGGPATWHEDQLLPIYRNGRLEEVYWTYSYSPILDSEDRIAGVLVTCFESTERIARTNRMQRSEEAVRDLFARAPVGISIFKGPSFHIEMINAKALQLWDKQGEEVIGKPLFSILPYLREQGFERILNDAYLKGKPFYSTSLETKTVRNGRNERLFINMALEPIYESDGRISGLVFIGADITEQALARLRQEETSLQFKNLVLQAPIPICVLRGQAHIVEIANAAMLDLWGVTGAEVLNQPVFSGLPQAANQGLEEWLHEVLTKGHRIMAEERSILLPRSGRLEETFVNFTYEPIREPDGRVTGVMVLAVDVTQQVLARRKVEDAEERLRLAIEAAELGTFDVDLATGHLFTSARTREIFGLEEGSERSDFIEAFHPDDRAIRTQALEQAMITGRLLYEVRVFRKGGGEHWIRAKGSVSYDASGTPLRLLGIILDITEQKRFTGQLEKLVSERTAELAQSNALLRQTNSELEQFAYIASHDLQEPLRKVRTFSEMLENSLGDVSPQAKKYLEKIGTASSRMLTLIRDVLNFSQLSYKGEKFQPVDLNEVVENIRYDFELLLEQKGAQLQTDWLPVINAIPLQINQLFHNLVSNALKFADPARKPLIQIRATMLKPEEWPLRPGLNHDRTYLQLRFSDNGIGFRQEYAEQIFTIFQRLHDKQSYSGTGIGLSLCKKIAANHEGIIYAESEPGVGSTFFVLLPAD